MPEPNDRSMQDLKPTVWIGKQGCSETMIEEIVAQLKKRKLIKVKWLQSAEVEPEEIAARAKARLVEVRGRTLVLAEKASGKTPVKKAARTTARTQGRLAAVQSGKRAPAARPPATEGPAKKPRQTGALKARKK
ncbi:YhbY family RNA-binding protein [Methanoregula sp.]|uniref:YhbY family RNA-binding protein n=1 Tax=Methanoregula sp. TaxID=2052170 RepID=UPI0034152E47